MKEGRVFGYFEEFKVPTFRPTFKVRLLSRARG
jgi:hypothetical protein